MCWILNFGIPKYLKVVARPGQNMKILRPPSSTKHLWSFPSVWTPWPRPINDVFKHWNAILLFRKTSMLNGQWCLWWQDQQEHSLSNRTAQKIKFSIKISSVNVIKFTIFIRIWSHLLKKYFMKNVFFVYYALRGNVPFDFVPVGCCL